MNRDQYFDRHRNLNIERNILEAKWRALQEEQQSMEQMMMFEAARAASSASVASGAGGGYLDPTFNDFVETGYVEDYFE